VTSHLTFIHSIDASQKETDRQTHRVRMTICCQGNAVSLSLNLSARDRSLATSTVITVIVYSTSNSASSHLSRLSTAPTRLISGQ